MSPVGRGDCLIQLADVSRVYPGPPAVAALRHVDLRIGRGEYVAVVGRSGSGKSTLLNLIGLLDRPTAGSYTFDGIDVTQLAERHRTALRGQRIGFAFQEFHLLPYRTALENVMLGQIYNSVPRALRRTAAQTMLSRVGLDNRRHALPTTLSGGERQRVAIARALVNAPDLLLCDEPTGSLDSATAGRLMNLLDELHGAGLTIVVITHDPDVALRAQRVVTIMDGHLTEREGPLRTAGAVS